MSRIGLLPIEIPAGVEVKIKDDNIVEVKGKNGTLEQKIDSDMDVKIEDNTITVSRPTDNKKHRSLHGLTRTLIYNMIVGVTEGYKKTLLIQGTGYRAAKQGKKLVLTLGFSHPVELEDPEGITVETPEATKIIISGANKQQVGNYAAVIRDFRKPEPYKGKGIRYEDEHVRRKVGKAGS